RTSHVRADEVALNAMVGTMRHEYAAAVVAGNEVARPGVRAADAEAVGPPGPQPHAEAPVPHVHCAGQVGPDVVTQAHNPRMKERIGEADAVLPVGRDVVPWVGCGPADGGVRHIVEADAIAT